MLSRLQDQQVINENAGQTTAFMSAAKTSQNVPECACRW